MPLSSTNSCCRLHQHSHEGPLDRIRIQPDEATSLARIIAAANESARAKARSRLRAHFPDAAISALATYFPSPQVFRREDRAQGKHWPLQRLIDAFCTRTHDFQIGEKAKGMQICVLPGRDPITLEMLGVPVEPDSSLCRPDPKGLLAAAAANASIEVRVFDRHLDAWAATADDIAAVSGADVFMKLFIAGGERSVNDWHRDTSDVLVTILDGRKRFEVGTNESTDEAPVDEVDAVLGPGDVLLLPRARLHNATPVGEVSALLSIGLMRMADWTYRSVSPTHLGLVNPISPRLYRLALLAHSAPNREAVSGEERLVSRIPGGLGLVREGGEVITFLACGRIWKSTQDIVEQLSRYHASDGLTPIQLAQSTGRDREDCLAVANELARAGLIKRASIYPPETEPGAPAYDRSAPMRVFVRGQFMA